MIRFLSAYPITTSSFLFAVVLGSLIGFLLSNAKNRRNFLLALRSLWLHKLRAFLSVLGIIIGTSAVISLMGFGEGSMQDALEDIKRMGATNVIVRSVKPPDDASSMRKSFVAVYGITKTDYERFTTLMQDGVVTRIVPMRIFPQEVRHLARLWQCRLVGTTPEYADVNQLEMATGRFLTEDDDLHMTNLAVLGSNTAAKLFPFDDPLGQEITMGTHSYRVVGVVKSRMPTGGSGGSQAAENFNDDVYIPLQTCRARYGESVFIRQSGSRSGEKVAYNQVTLTVSETDLVRRVGEVVRNMMEQHVKPDWQVTIPLDRLEEAERAKDRYNMLLGMIASISLLVGGIGIMNIMLATVTERTREIGIRRALGAKRRDITVQFLVEAVVQTTIGGIVGVFIGLGIVLSTPWVADFVFEAHLPARVHILSIYLALGSVLLVGIAFGLYPAWRASRLDPIEALRHE
jgi:putative ABC transport system permease protein